MQYTVFPGLTRAQTSKIEYCVFVSSQYTLIYVDIRWSNATRKLFFLVIFVRMKHILLIHERTSYVSLVRYIVTWPLSNTI